jgi:hypothetical protein
MKSYEATNRRQKVQEVEVLHHQKEMLNDLVHKKVVT